MIIVYNRVHARALVEETQTRNAGKPRRGAGFRRFFYVRGKGLVF